MAIVERVATFYIRSDGTYIKETVGGSHFYPQDNYSNRLYACFEDGIGVDTMVQVNFRINNRNISHWLRMGYVDQVTKTIDDVEIVFARFQMPVPNQVLSQGNVSSTTTIDLSWRLVYGEKWIGFYQTLGELDSAYPATEALSLGLNTAFVIDSPETGFYQVELVDEVYTWVNQGQVAEQPLQIKSYGLAQITLQAGQSNPNGTVTISTTATEALMTDVTALEVRVGSLEDAHTLLAGRVTAVEEDIADIIDGDITAKKAEQDASGNVITTTYETIGNVALKEDVANKVTAFQVTPDDTHYPSEKLVADELNDKEDVVHKATNFSVVNDTLYPSVEAVKEQLDLKEDVSNKVTSFQVTPDDTHYPSEKLVKDKLDLKEDKANKGSAGGYPELDESGKVPLSQTYGTLNDLQDVYIVGATALAVDWLSLTEGGTALTPESGNWYHVITVGDYQGESYRWSGSAYVLVSSDLILGETSNTAYRGDRGKTGYDHSQVVDGSNPHGTTFANVASKPTTIVGFGITDAYDKDYIDGLQDNNGWEQTDLTPTALVNADTLVTATLQGYNEVRFICRNETTDEVDTDSIVGSQLTTGTKIIFFDDIDVYFLVGATNSTFTEDDAFTLKVYGVTYTQQLAENIATDFTGTNFLDAETNVEDSLIALDTQVKTNADDIVLVEGRLDVVEPIVEQHTLEIRENELRIDTVEETLRKAVSSSDVATSADTEVIHLGKDVANAEFKVLVEGMTLQASQIVVNPNMDLTTGWLATSSTQAFALSILSNTGNGGSVNPYSRELLTGITLENKIYYKVRFRVTNALSTTVDIGNTSWSGYTSTLTPTNGTWYEVSAVKTTATDLYFYLMHRYANTTNATGAVMEVDYAYSFNISTLISNKQYSPISNTTFDLMSDANIKTQMDAWVARGELPNDSIQSVSGNKKFEAVGKNLFDGVWVSGRYNPTTGVSEANASYIRTLNYIRVKPSTQYEISNDSAVGYGSGANRGYVFYDYNKNIILPVVGTFGQFTTTSNTHYVRISSDISTSLQTKMQVAIGSTPSTYEAFTNSVMYLQSHEQLNRLPNGVKDTIEYRNGKYYYVQRVQEYTLVSGDITSMHTALSNVDYANVSKQSDYAYATTSIGITGSYYAQGWLNSTEIDSLESIGTISFNSSSTKLFYGFAKGTTLAQAQSVLAGTKILYQLATPVETEIDSSGQLIGGSRGTVYISDAIKPQIVFYTTNAVIENSNYPISTLGDEILRWRNGVETVLDISDATIAGDGLSFTHTDLTAGDMVLFSYNYVNTNNVYGLSTITYYDANNVTVDSVDSKVYKITPTIANGVLTWTLTAI